MAEAKVGRHSRWLRAGLAPVMAWLLLSPAAPAFETLEGWTKQRDRSGVQVYTAEVRGSRYRAFRGVTLLCAPIAELIRVNRDVDGFADWLPDLEEVRLLEQQALEQTHYIRSTTPFPLRDRDMIYHLQVQDPPDADDVRISLTGLPDRLPAEPEVVRMSAARGGWRFTDTDEGVRTEFRMHVEPGGEVPAWIVNRGLVRNPYLTLRALRERYPCD